jgi:cellulose synthase/poly-beta-1,6-N-acetylglucosamine synthase-like glycosyltransferase
MRWMMGEGGLGLPGWQEWTEPTSLASRWIPRIAFLAAVVGCFVVSRHGFAESKTAWLWGIVGIFYLVFYWRIAGFTYWAHATYRRLARTFPEPASRPPNPTGSSTRSFPVIHILIAAYEAQESIPAVIRALGNQAYPKDRYHAWIITERKEREAKEAQRKQLLAQAEADLAAGRVSDSMRQIYWFAETSTAGDLAEWCTLVLDPDSPLRAYLHNRDATDMLTSDLLRWSLAMSDSPEALEVEWTRLGIGRIGRSFLHREVVRAASTLERVSADFERLLGSRGIYRTDDIEREVVQRAVSGWAWRFFARSLRARLGSEGAQPLPPPLERVTPILEATTLSTQDSARVATRDSDISNVHVLDPYGRGFKPGALNHAYRHLRDNGHLTGEGQDEALLLIIDSDSLLPDHALSAVAEEVEAEGRPTPVMQLASVPTANFFSAGWYSRFVSLADSVGAVGKWSRSTRQRQKPDLHAGSGVVLPASLAEYLDRQQDGPWTETTLTEDARVIIGQFGMMNHGRNLTRMVPAYLLEAVPASRSFLETYRSFWNQRRRWTTGGYDEAVYLWGLPDWVLFARFDAAAGAWTQESPAAWPRIRARSQQARRWAVWVWDHFWWGIGGGIILTHWWLVSFMIAAPNRTTAALGLVALLLTPLLYLLFLTRYVTLFTPGGMSAFTRVVLYGLCFVAIWLYALPVVVVQISCLVGRRSGMLDWRPTQKPRFQLGTGIGEHSGPS